MGRLFQSRMLSGIHSSSLELRIRHPKGIAPTLTKKGIAPGISSPVY